MKKVFLIPLALSILRIIEEDSMKRIDEATEKCKAAPMPPEDIMATDVYADGGWAWRN